MKVCFIAFLNLLCVQLSAQQGNYVSGGRAAALGNSGITLADEFASVNNIGALAESQSSGVFCSFKSNYDISGPGAYTAGFNLEALGGVGTINFYKFGDQLFSENKVGLGFSHTLGFTSLGIQANYLQYRIEGYGKASTFVIEVGGLAQPLPGLYLAGYIWNISKSSVSKLDESDLQVILKGGLLYKPHKSFGLSLVFQSRREGKVDTYFGIEYFIREVLYIRTGFHVSTSSASFGLGFLPGKFKLDYAISIIGALGLSHQVSLIYQLNTE